MFKWISRLRLWQRITIYLLPVIVIPATVLMILLFTSWASDNERRIRENESNHVTNLATVMEQFFNTPENDIRFLAEDNAVRSLGLALRDGGEAEIADLTRRAGLVFVAQINASEVFNAARDDTYPVYQHIGFVSPDGQERVRVDRDYTPDSEGVNMTTLQDLSSDDDFLRALTLEPGEVYVSPLTLYRDEVNNELQLTPEGEAIPLIPYSIPVYVNEQLVGFVAVHLYAQNVLDLVQGNATDAEAGLLDQEGYWLANRARPGAIFGFDPEMAATTGFAPTNVLENDPRIDIKTAVNMIVGPANVTTTDITPDGYYVTYKAVAPRSAGYRWQIVNIRSENELFADLNRNSILGLIGLAATIVFSTVFTLLISRQITSPLRRLQERTQLLAQGRLDVPMDESTLERHDEIGELNRGFSAMAKQLGDLFGTMEQRIQARTTDLEATAEIATAVNQVRDVDDLLSLTVNLIRDRFNFYYTQVYLVDVTQEYAVLREGTGFVGRKLLARHHQLPLSGRSLVATAIRTTEPIVVQDTTTDPNFLRNELLPDTRSELTIPLRSQGQIVGVLDIQHNQPFAFDNDLIRLFQSMADQLTITLDNVQLLQETQRRAVEMETVAQVGAEATSTLNVAQLLLDVSELVKERFNLYHAHVYLYDANSSQLILAGGAGEVGNMMAMEKRSIALSSQRSFVAYVARERQGAYMQDVTREPNFLPHPLLPDTKAELAVPMVVGETLVGVLDVQSDKVNHFVDTDLRIMATLASQIAVAVQNARSYELTQRRANELATVASVSAEAALTLDPEQLLINAAELTSVGFNLYHIHIYEVDAENRSLRLVAGTGRVACQHVGHDYHLYLDRDINAVSKTVLTQQPVIDNAVIPQEFIEFNPYLPETRSMFVVPMLVAGEVIGVIEIHADHRDAFTEEDIQVYQMLTNQLAVALQNAHSFAQTRRHARELQTVARVSADASANLDLSKLLFDASDLVKESFQLYHAHIYLMENRGETLVLRGGAGEIGRKMVAENRNIPTNSKQSIVARVSRERRAVVINDVRADEDFLPHPLLPQTRAEMAIPLLIGDEVVGVLDVQSEHTGRFGEDDVQVQATLANQLAVAVQNARSFAETQRRANELALVSQVSAEVTTMLDQQTLLQNVVDATKERFNLYHAHIYLINDDRTSLTLAAGAGDIGKSMVARGHSIPLKAKRSVVVQAVLTRRPIIVNDVTLDENFLPNPLLPQTWAELATPLIIGDEVLGVLDVQAKEVNRFTENDAVVHSTLAAQIAVAVQNARSFAETERRLREVQIINLIAENNRRSDDLESVLEGALAILLDAFGADTAVLMIADPEAGMWHGQVGVGGGLTSKMAKTFIDPYESYPHAVEAMEAKQVIAVSKTTTYAGFPEGYIESLGLRSVLTLPVFRGADTTGVIFLNYTENERRFDAQDMTLARTLAEQISVMIEIKNAEIAIREARRRAELLAGINSALSQADAEEDMLFALIDLVQEQEIILANLMYTEPTTAGETPTYADVIAVMDMNGTAMPPQMIYPVLRFTEDVFPTLPFIWEDPYEPLVISDIYHDERLQDEDSRTFAQQAGLGALVGIPLVRGDEWMGIVTLVWALPHAFSQEFIDLARAIMPSLTSVVATRRAFLREQDARDVAETLYRVGEIVNIADTPQQLAEAIANQSGLEPSTTTLIIFENYDVNGATYFEMLGLLTDEDNPMLSPFGTQTPIDVWPAALRSPGVWRDTIEDIDAPNDESQSQVAAARYLGYRALIGVAFSIGQRVMGWLTMYYKEPRPFSDRDRRVMDGIGELLAAAIERYRLSLATQRRASELATVANVSTATTTMLNVEELLQAVADLTKESFALYHAHIYLVDEDRNSLVLAGGAGDAGRLMKQRRHSIPLRAQTSLVVQAWRERQGVIVNDVQSSPAYLPNPLLPETRSEMAIPMIVGDRVIGVLDVQSDRVNRFDDQDVQVQSVLAAQVAVAVQNAMSFSEVQHQAEREREISERLREVDRLKSQFLANMSHELRTPLNSIIGYSEVLLDGVDGELTLDAEEDVQAIHDSGKHLLSLINEILDLAKIEAGEMHLDRKPANIVDFASEIIKTGQVLVKAKPVVLEVVVERELPPVWADHVRLRQIIWNLISNAVKFTEQGSVRIHLNMHDEENVLVAVRDTGIGMSERDLAVIFERFSQVDGSSTRRAGGSGLGLTITKQLIEMHGGMIDVESAIGVGSTFWFTLPIYVEEKQGQNE